MNRSDLLSEELIVGNSKPYQKGPAIYFLIQGGKVVYVGQSKNVNERIGHHITQQGKPFDAYYAVYVDRLIVNVIESAYIEAFQPIYNHRENKGYSADRHAEAIRTSAGLTAGTTASSC